jgi:ABC-2 type transport system permease protein
MRNIWIIAKKEFKHFFISPIAYAVAFMVLLILGVIFYANILVASNQQQYSPGIQIVLGPMVTLFLFSTPAITMRTIADEQKTGTLELLLTAPVRDWASENGWGVFSLFSQSSWSPGYIHSF